MVSVGTGGVRYARKYLMFCVMQMFGEVGQLYVKVKMEVFGSLSGVLGLFYKFPRGGFPKPWSAAGKPESLACLVSGVGVIHSCRIKVDR